MFSRPVLVLPVSSPFAFCCRPNQRRQANSQAFWRSWKLSVEVATRCTCQYASGPSGNPWILALDVHIATTIINFVPA